MSFVQNEHFHLYALKIDNTPEIYMANILYRYTLVSVCMIEHSCASLKLSVGILLKKLYD